MPPTEPTKPTNVETSKTVEPKPPETTKVDPTKPVTPAPADASKQDAKPPVNTAPASGQDVARDDNADRGTRAKDEIGAVVKPTTEEQKVLDEKEKSKKARVDNEIKALVVQYTLIQLAQLAQSEQVPIPAGANSEKIATAIVEQREVLRRTGHATVS